MGGQNQGAVPVAAQAKLGRELINGGGGPQAQLALSWFS